MTGSYDQAVKVWDCRSRSFDPVQVMTDASDSVTSVTTNTAGGRAEVAAASVDGGVRRYDIRMGCLFTDALHVPVTHLAASRDGAMLLAACMDSCIRLLDRAEGDLLMEFRGDGWRGKGEGRHDEAWETGATPRMKCAGPLRCTTCSAMLDRGDPGTPT